MSTLKPECILDLCDDIWEMIFVQLEPRLNYNSVVREYSDPRFHKGASRVHRSMFSNANVHYGRVLVYVIYPTTDPSPHQIRSFPSEAINIYGLRLRSRERSTFFNHGASNYETDMSEFKHSDLDRTLSQLGEKRFKSKNKKSKIQMLLKYNI